jgi:hypothetical protein
VVVVVVGTGCDSGTSLPIQLIHAGGVLP